MRNGFVSLNKQRVGVSVNEKDEVVYQGQIINSPTWLPITTGTVYGIALNYKGLLTEHLASFNTPPYKQPPVKPVLFIKTPNTYNAHLGKIVFPKGVERIQAGPTLAFVISKDASRVSKDKALNYVAGYTLANEVSLPEDSYYRPAVKAKCRDSFCPMGPYFVTTGSLEPKNLTIQLKVNGEVKQENNTNNLIRQIPQIIEELTEFMTLKAGDVVLTGIPEGRVDINIGDTVEIHIEGIGTLTNIVVAE
ncbi:4-hydroxyphenylacetate isomerase [Entomomonas moraniae]|uniref:4-hydroxyphenylacetate isomerase n=1 Tax=Entomomonas moraniae TaxID=2213226 RepID=A0A3S9XCM2_9GAMM|nr:fumarylacetoacetate hydrolase family protein [Entomomonas moraniae]AZS50160.1 4-hydroxyphenylacetate isomerase [Entomomonas moraniae]